MSDAVETSIHCGTADNMVMNPTIDDFSAITRGGWNFQGENRIPLYLNVFKHFLYSGRPLNLEHGLTATIYPPNISSAFVDEKNRQTVTKFSSVLFNTQVKAFKHDGHLCTLRTVLLASLMQHNEALEIITGEANMITVALI